MFEESFLKEISLSNMRKRHRKTLQDCMDLFETKYSKIEFKDADKIIGLTSTGELVVCTYRKKKWYNQQEEIIEHLVKFIMI